MAPRATLWIAAERVPQVGALWPGAKLEPVIAAPPVHAGQEWSADAALIEILRGRLEGQGPVTVDALAASLGIETGPVCTALGALEAEGFAMRGRFTPMAIAEEWCDRRLLARINHYTVKRLRAEIEPVSASDFLRFLLAWQRLTTDTRMEGPEALKTIVEQLEGFEAPVDDHCLAGRIAWARLRPVSERLNGGERNTAPAPLRTTPITLLTRCHAPLWASLSPPGETAAHSVHAQAVLAFIREHGASFFDELVEGTGLLRSQAEEALAELVAIGLVNSDSFGGLRALLVPSGQRRSTTRAGHRRRTVAFSMEHAGRWALARRSRPTPMGPQTEADAAEHVARALLLRYGVVF